MVSVLNLESKPCLAVSYMRVSFSFPQNGNYFFVMVLTIIGLKYLLKFFHMFNMGEAYELAGEGKIAISVSERPSLVPGKKGGISRCLLRPKRDDIQKKLVSPEWWQYP